MNLIFQLTCFDIFADVAFGPPFIFLYLLLELNNHIGQITDFVIFFNHFVVDLRFFESLRTLNTCLHASHQVIVLRFKLLDIPLKLLSVFEKIFVLLSQLKSILTVLELLDDVIILSLELTIFFIHHGHPVVLFHVIVSHRAGLKLGIVVGERLILFEELVVAMLPNS